MNPTTPEPTLEDQIRELQRLCESVLVYAECGAELKRDMTTIEEREYWTKYGREGFLIGPYLVRRVR